MKNRIRYLVIAVLIFILEVLIALFVNDAIIRPYVGDYLVVIMLYCFVKAVTRASLYTAAVAVLIFAYLIEFFQYLNLIAFLNLQHSRLANTVLGNYFSWNDMAAYTLGIITVLIVEHMISRHKRKGALQIDNN